MNHDAHKSDTGLSQNTDSVTTDPAVTFENITFSDGTTITLESTDVVVLVGPNNAGKSVALRELEEHVESSFEETVVTRTKLCRSGTLEELRAYMKRYTRERATRSTLDTVFTLPQRLSIIFGLLILVPLASSFVCGLRRKPV